MCRALATAVDLYETTNPGTLRCVLLALDGCCCRERRALLRRVPAAAPTCRQGRRPLAARAAGPDTRAVPCALSTPRCHATSALRGTRPPTARRARRRLRQARRARTRPTAPGFLRLPPPAERVADLRRAAVCGCYCCTWRTHLSCSRRQRPRFSARLCRRPPPRRTPPPRSRNCSLVCAGAAQMATPPPPHRYASHNALSASTTWSRPETPCRASNAVMSFTRCASRSGSTPRSTRAAPAQKDEHLRDLGGSVCLEAADERGGGGNENVGGESKRDVCAKCSSSAREQQDDVSLPRVRRAAEVVGSLRQQVGRGHASLSQATASAVSCRRPAHP